MIDALKNKKAIIFGSGDFGKIVIKEGMLRIEYIVDNDINKHGFIGAIPVKGAEHLKDIDKDSYIIVVANCKHYDTIAAQLIEMGFVEGKDFIDCIDVVERLKELRQPDFNKKQAKNPKVISFELTRACNSRCTMCDCWRRSSPKILTLKQVEKIFSDPALESLIGVNLNGGEPMLLDLQLYFNILLERLPNLEFISISSNGMLTKRIIKSVPILDQMCKEKGVKLTFSISIDGLGNVNDTQRGVTGAFERASASLKALKETGVDLQICTTITKINLWNMDELLVWEDIAGVTSINRIARSTSRYVDEDRLFIDAFDEDDLYQLRLLMYKLKIKGDSHQNIISDLTLGIMNNENRMQIANCPFLEGNGFFMDCQGNVGYCSQQYELGTAGNLADDTYDVIYQRICDKKSFAQETICRDCLYEYCVTPASALIEEKASLARWHKFYTTNYFYNNPNTLDMLLTMSSGVKEPDTILITGWYGTETIGDKAILGGLIQKYRASGAKSISVTSIYPFVTTRTLKELGEHDVEIIPAFSRSALLAAMRAETVVMGGGPLMELDLLALPLWLFAIAKKSGGKTIVDGCGIGPIYSEERTNAINDILKYADEIILRDTKSARVAEQLTARKDISVSDDPAVAYLNNRLSIPVQGNRASGTLALFLREITEEYRGNISTEDFEKQKAKFEYALAENIKLLCKEKKLFPRFYSMHNFVIGGDDRDFNFMFTSKYFEKGTYWVDNMLTSIEKIVSVMESVGKCICMRFHSVAFANTLGVDFVAIDYTNGGKIEAFLTDKAKTDRLVKMENIIVNKNAISLAFDC